MTPETIVFVHGWSVTNTDAYGGLPERLAAEFAARGQELSIEHLWLSRYVSFRDNVRMSDLAFAMRRAVERELAPLLERGERFAVITHSTGGPVVRTWWYEYFARRGERCPMSHLIMLAPANFGSALVQLGKGRISRLRSWGNGVEPGQGVLDWLEHGSNESWNLNEAWIRGKFKAPSGSEVFSFVLTGQTITRALYDHLNPYTGEVGTDGVIRAAAANLNATYARFRQSGPAADQMALVSSGPLLESPACAFRLVADASHVGKAHGILDGVEPHLRGKGDSVAAAVIRCLEVGSARAYEELSGQFKAETAEVMASELVELERVRLFPDRWYFHDAMSMVICRLTDSDGFPLNDFDLLLTGPDDDPDHLPRGFMVDRQRNMLERNVLTFYLNHSVMHGCGPTSDPRSPERTVRDAIAPMQGLGLRVSARPSDGFVHYVPASYRARKEFLEAVIRPHQTTLLDIVLRRVVRRGVFEMDTGGKPPQDFARTDRGPALEE